MSEPDKRREEIVLWLIRSVLAAVVGVMVWGARFLTSDPESEYAKFTIATDSLSREQQADLKILEQLLEAGKRRSSRHAGAVEGKVRSTATPRTERLRLADSLAIAAADDSAKISALALIGVTDIGRRSVLASEIVLGRERRYWEAVAHLAMDDRGAAKAVARAADEEAIARVGLIAVVEHTEARIAAQEKRAIEIRDQALRLSKMLRTRARLAAVALVVGLLVLQAFAAFAFTGRMELLPGWKKTSP